LRANLLGQNWGLISISSMVTSSQGERIPILLMAYCRPIEFSRIASDLESLSPRVIEISIDGPSSGTEADNKSVVELAKLWSLSSKHEISLRISKTNLGLFDHFSTALDHFFSQHRWGLVLEDDLEIRDEIVDFLDTEIAKTLLDQYFSFCGHNPLSDLSEHNRAKPILLQETNIHTIHGWAASSSSVQLFLDLLKDYGSDELVLKRILKNFCQNVTRDPFLARSLFKNWSGKIDRSIHATKPNWDNYWELAAWSSGKTSFRPTFSLTRENPISFGKQTHNHNFRTKVWPNHSKRIALEPHLLLPVNRALEISALKVWGTSRARAYKEFLRSALGK
jgi:hypothetical protein